ncbi:MAG: glutathione S-transferase family protein [bacterium]|nr:glutathione S-transferase family protein [bacterium]MCP5045108.1 glutathione S-transferase family protein [bacterium]
MKLHNSVGPNPHLVRIFAHEKNIPLDLVAVDLMSGENRQDAYKTKNPAGQLPCLELDDRTFVAETLVICEYLEDVHPDPALIGATPEQRANTRMWTRRAELAITAPLAEGFRYSEGLALFKDRMRTIPEAADGLKAKARDGLAWLDGQIEGREFIAGDHFSLADVLLISFLMFGAQVGQPLDPSLENMAAWYERVSTRPSVEQTA